MIFKNMTEKPILFSGSMVRAIREDRKTMTRRVVKPQPIAVHDLESKRKQRRGDLFIGPDIFPTGDQTNLVFALALDNATTRMLGSENLCNEFCPYGQPGGRLWVRETWCRKCDDGVFAYNKEGNLDPSCCYYAADGVHVVKGDGDGGTEFRKDGTEASPWSPSIHMPRWASRITLKITGIRVERLQEITRDGAIAEGCPKEVADAQDACQWYRDLWDSINAKRGHGWDENPWVWIIEFQKH